MPGWAAAADGYAVNTDFGGHGIGSTMHQDPHVSNDGRPGRGYKLRPGLLLALELEREREFGVLRALGLPVVATAIAGIPEIVEEGVNGYLIQPGDIDALADRLVRLACDPGLRRAMGQANRRRVWMCA